MKAFDWDDQKREAAQLIARGNLSFGKIAKQINCHPRTLYNWRENEEFIAQVQQHVSDYKEAVRRRGIAIVERRVDAQHKRWVALHQIARERGRDEKWQHIAGWKTGWLTHDVKSIGGGEFMTTVDLFQVDTGLLREIRELEKQAAQELGQWTSKVDVHQTKTLAEISGEMDLAGESYQPERNDQEAS